MSLLQTENLHNDLQTGNQLLGHFPAKPVICHDVGFAFTGIDDDGVYFANAAGELYIGGEGSTAHAHDTGFPDDGDQLLGSQRVNLFLGSGLDVLMGRAQMVILNNNT